MNAALVALLGASLASLVASSAAWAAEREAPRAAAPIEVRLPADILYSRTPGSDSTVVFSHATHAALVQNRCTTCHPQPFHLLKRGPRPTHGEMNAGRSCGMCHDGKQAFGVRDAASCATCHAGVAAAAAPGVAAPGAGTAAARKVPGPHAYPQGADSPGRVTFRHDRHMKGAVTCAACHGKLFRMAAAPPRPGGGMHESAACGACHDGKQAFAAEDPASCLRCHIETGGRP